MLDQEKEFSGFNAHKELFKQLQHKRIFLSGGTGFFGKWLLESFFYLNKAFVLNASMTVLSRDTTAFVRQWPGFDRETSLTLIQGDVRDFKFPSGKFDYLIHAASEVSLGTRRILDLAVQAGVSRFMITSSGAVYGPQPHEMSHLPETHREAPMTDYGKAKLSAEEICVQTGNRFGFSVLLPRCFAFVGPYLDLDIQYAIGNFIRDCLEGRPIIIKGDGSAVRSYLYAADLAEWLWIILLCGVHARVYNVGSSQAITIRDLADRVRDRAGNPNPIEILGASTPGVRQERYVPSVERASSELNLKPRCSLDEAIDRTLAWHRQI